MGPSELKFVENCFQLIHRGFGTTDPSWFRAAEAYLNVIMDFKNKKAALQIREFIQALAARLFASEQRGGDINEFRRDVTDNHFAQVFFVVGHASIKMLAYLEQQEDMIKRVIGEDGSEEEKKEEHDMILGGSEREVDEALKTFNFIREEIFVDRGLFGDFVPSMVTIAKKTL